MLWSEEPKLTIDSLIDICVPTAMLDHVLSAHRYNRNIVEPNSLMLCSFDPMSFPSSHLLFAFRTPLVRSHLFKAPPFPPIPYGHSNNPTHPHQALSLLTPAHFLPPFPFQFASQSPSSILTRMYDDIPAYGIRNECMQTRIILLLYSRAVRMGCSTRPNISDPGHSFPYMYNPHTVYIGVLIEYYHLQIHSF